MNTAFNVFTNLPDSPPTDEITEILARSDDVTIERIISKGHTTPPGEWYDQDTNEWVLVLQGGAKLRIDGQADLISMSPGDCVHIPAHLRHRVEWTNPAEYTIWLAVHYPAAESSRT